MFVVVKASYILLTCPYFNNLEFDNFNARGPQWHFLMTVAIADTIPMLSSTLSSVWLVHTHLS